jgi:hypothetical protein
MGWLSLGGSSWKLTRLVPVEDILPFSFFAQERLPFFAQERLPFFLAISASV